MKKNDFWGYHLMLDCADCNIQDITNKDNICNFTKQLVKDIDMTAYGEPQIIHLGKDDKAGFTLVQLIETSNICAHFCDPTKSIYIDVFSCKPYDSNLVINLVKQYFNPLSIKKRYFTRQA